MRDELLEHAEYVSNAYGTPRSFVEEKLSEGMNVLLENLGAVDAERFIALMNKEPFDYT